MTTENINGNLPSIKGLTNINTTKVMIVFEMKLPNYGTGRFVKIFGDDADMNDIEDFKADVTASGGTVVYENWLDALVESALIETVEQQRMRMNQCVQCGTMLYADRDGAGVHTCYGCQEEIALREVEEREAQHPCHESEIYEEMVE